MKLRLLALSMAAALGTTSAHALELSYSSHLPPSIAINSAGIIPLFEQVAADTDGEVTVKYFWAGSLFNAAGNFEAVRDGVVHAAFTQPQSNQADMRINALFADLYHYGSNPFATAAAYTETVLIDCERCAEEYESNNIQFLGSHSATPAALICASPVGSMDDLRGRRIIGQPALSRWAQTLGGTQLDVPPPGQMEAIQRGQADCTFAAREWLTAFSLLDVADTVVDVPVGAQFATSIMSFNKDSWDGLPDNVRESILRNMPVAISGILTAYAEREALAIEQATAQGVTFTVLDGAFEESLDGFMEGQRERVLADAAARGIENPEEIVEAFLANKEKWEGLLEEHGNEQFAQLLWDEVFSKLEN